MADELTTSVAAVASGETAEPTLDSVMKDQQKEEATTEADASPKDDDDPDDVDAQLEAMKRRLEHVEAEAQRIQMGNGAATAAAALANETSNGISETPVVSAPGAPTPAVPQAAAAAPVAADTEAAISESDARSVYVGNVDYGATVEELGMLFSDCGTINRVTIMTNKATGMPKGFAYIEFAEESSVKHATILDNSMFRERKLKVVPKRTNVPGLSYRGRGRARYGRGYGRGYGRRPRRGMRGRWAPY